MLGTRQRLIDKPGLNGFGLNLNLFGTDSYFGGRREGPEGSASPGRGAKAQHADFPPAAEKRDLNECLSGVDGNAVVGQELGHVKVIAILTSRSYCWPQSEMIFWLAGHFISQNIDKCGPEVLKGPNCCHRFKKAARRV